MERKRYMVFVLDQDAPCDYWVLRDEQDTWDEIKETYWAELPRRPLLVERVDVALDLKIKEKNES